MKKGIGIVTCGVCRQTTAVVWPGHKYKMPCPNCKAMMNIHRKRLKKFEALKNQ